MQITAIEEKRKGLSAVYIDGEYAMKLDTFALANLALRLVQKSTTTDYTKLS